MATTGSRRVLIVDDSPASAQITARAVEAAGFAFDIARDGFEAINRLGGAPYAAVLLDYVMPGMDGVDVMRWIQRRMDRPPAVYVLSSEDIDVLRRKFAGLGISGILTKPASTAAICGALEPA